MNMESATMPTSYLFTNAAAKKKTGTPEKATASAVPRKWGSRSGGKGRRDGDGTAVFAGVCRPSCRWAKARRQKIGAGERRGRRKKGQGADERRQLRRQLDEAEARVEELEGEVEDRDGQLRAAKEREEQAAVGEWRKEAEENTSKIFGPATDIAKRG